jgi:cellulose synthase/poly-beta-1,6-N-acetylglucosamine synthase-like glycosyltransferase
MTLRCTIIVPVYNGAATITRCLEALAQQTIVAEAYEIIVVDDGSRDATATLVQEWINQHPGPQVRLLQQANAGPAAARNRGASVAATPLLLFTDADCAPLPHWIETFLHILDDPRIAGAKGTYQSKQPEWVAQFVQAEYEDRYERMAKQPAIDFIDTYSAAYRRAIFLEQGGFDPTLIICEDQEFSFRLVQKGYLLRFAPAACVVHRHVDTVRGYARRKFAIGYWKSLLVRWHPERMVRDSHTPQVLKGQILLVAALFGLLFLGGLSLFWPLLRWSWIGLALCAALFLVSAAPFLQKLARKSPHLALFGVFLLLVRALALGAGFLGGAIHFALTKPAAANPTIVTLE